MLTKISANDLARTFIGRFDRFAKTSSEKTSAKPTRRNYAQLDAVWDQLNIVRKLDKKVADASVEEGYGRLDALNRIGNQVFGLDLGEDAGE